MVGRPTGIHNRQRMGAARLPLAEEAGCLPRASPMPPGRVGTLQGVQPLVADASWEGRSAVRALELPGWTAYAASTAGEGTNAKTLTARNLLTKPPKHANRN